MGYGLLLRQLGSMDIAAKGSNDLTVNDSNEFVVGSWGQGCVCVSLSVYLFRLEKRVNCLITYNVLL